MIEDRYAIGQGWVRPTLALAGTEAQQTRWLPDIEVKRAVWCQLFSEPGAGSDLAGLSTVAVRDGESYVVNGQKLWSSYADTAQWGILLARTDTEVAKHKGISYFCLDMSLPGIEVRPIVEMTGGCHFNEVFFTDVRVPVDCRVGEEGDGWRLATVTLTNERVALSEGGLCWGMGPTTGDLIGELQDRARREGPLDDPLLRQEVAGVYAERFVLNLLGARPDGPAASIRKTMTDRHGQRVTSLAMSLRGTDALLGTAGPDFRDRDEWAWAYLFSRALTIGGGTSEVQRNVIGERLLGLPREPA